ncbi:MAG: transposase [Pedobacter sp.]|nr:transposase [Chitinophagaceae bacterium]
MKKGIEYSAKDLELLEKIADIKWKNGYACKKCANTTYYERKSKPFARMCSNCKHIESPTANTALDKIRFPISVAISIIHALRKDRNQISKILQKYLTKSRLDEIRATLKGKPNYFEEQIQQMNLNLPIRLSYQDISAEIKKDYKLEIDPFSISFFLTKIGKAFKKPKGNRWERLSANVNPRVIVYYSFFMHTGKPITKNLIEWESVIKLLYKPDGKLRRNSEILHSLVFKQFIEIPLPNKTVPK